MTTKLINNCMVKQMFLNVRDKVIVHINRVTEVYFDYQVNKLKEFCGWRTTTAQIKT